jgi:hypothetical protein
MRSHLHNRISKIEQAVMAGKVQENERDPALVSFMACFGIPEEKCPRGVTATEWLTEACKGARILGVATRLAG